MSKGHDKGHKGQMSDRDVMKLALEALESAADNECNFHDYKHAAAALRQALEQPECNQHPDAPHGFNRESSHSLGRYVCDCEGWEPEREWQGLTDEEIAEGAKHSWVEKQAFESAVWWAESKLREKNGF